MSDGAGLPRRIGGAVADFLVDHAWVDLILPAALVGTNLALARWHARFDRLAVIGVDRRMTIYSDTLLVTGIILGFTVTALAAYLTVGSDRIAFVRSAAGPKLTRQWIAACTGPAIAVIVLLASEVFDGTPGHGDGAGYPWFRWVAEWAVFLVVARGARLLYVFAKLLAIAEEPTVEVKLASAPDFRSRDAG